jgi:hypothetical protein
LKVKQKIPVTVRAKRRANRRSFLITAVTRKQRSIENYNNILAHGYDIIDVAAMWDFVQNRVPELLEKVQDY